MRARWVVALVMAMGVGVGWGQGPAAVPVGTIHVLLLNGNDGKPLTIGGNGNAGTGMGLFISPECARACVFPNDVFGFRVNAAGEAEVPMMAGMTGLDVSKPSDWFKYCQDIGGGPGKLETLPRFSVEQIVRTGVVAPNTCSGRVHVQARPGQLVFFLRPLTVWEKLKKPPQM